VKNYTYNTVIEPIVIQLNDKWESLLLEADAEEANANRKHTRPDHKYAPGKPLSINTLDCEGEWFADKKDHITDIAFSVDLEKAMKVLTKLQRRYVIEVLIIGHSYAEMARKDNISESVVRRHIKRASEKLKKYFSQIGSDF
jgi:DNA-directed RNA polymerase specialized sigma24 family protein